MRLALYTAVYPGVEEYLGQWYSSVREQTDRDFTLWIALDSLSREAACEAIGEDPGATWIIGVPGDTVAQIRQRSFERLVEQCDAVVMVDSDDVLLPSRVAAARAALERSDLTACALRLVDEVGASLGSTMSLPDGMTPDGILPRHNLFGLSNSAYRVEMLRRCLPIPAETVLVDWLLATRAWLRGASITFDNIPRMAYRQHGANTARVLPSFPASRLTSDTGLVLQHFRLATGSTPEGALADRVAEVAEVAADIEAFNRMVVENPHRLLDYVEVLNRLEIAPLWWSCVAHPLLREMWTDTKEDE